LPQKVTELVTCEYSIDDMGNWVITDFQLSYILEQATGLASIETMIRLGHIKSYVSKSEAFRLYGRNNILTWVDQGLIRPIKDGQHSAVYRMERLDLEAISRSIQVVRILNSDRLTP